MKKIVTAYGRGLFNRLEEFFVRATGKNAADFATLDSFDDAIRNSASEIVPRAEKAFVWLDTEVRSFQAREGLDAFRAAKALGGMRLVLGGSSRFLVAQLRSVSAAVLYSDTVFIPDPVMPWLETERSEERFRHVHVLEAVHTLLQLKPLVDAEIHCPAIVVFPSYEKSLETHDEQTQLGISQLIADVLAHFLDESLTSIQDARDYAMAKPELFQAAVEVNNLFVAPNGPVGQSLVTALDSYDAEIRTWRSEEWQKAYERMPAPLRVLNGMIEQLGPIYHLLENADEFGGHPLMCLEQHAHYYGLVSATNSARLEELGLVDPKTRALIDALGSRRLEWLGNLSVDDLVRFRQANENANFRALLMNAVARLHDSHLGDVNRVASEVCHEISSAIADHEQEMRHIQAKYDRTHAQTGVLALAGMGVSLLPSLAPFLGGVAPFALAAKYTHNKIAELAEKQEMTQSLVGVLANARGTGI